MIKILFVEIIDTSSEVESRYPGLGMAYLASALRTHLGDIFEFKIIEQASEDELARQLEEFKPNLVGLSAVTQNFNLVKKCARFLKKRNIPTILGGIHISMLPESLPREVDLGCLGEGEETIVELMNLFKLEGGFPEAELNKIKGLVFWDEKNNLVITPARLLIENLDDISRPARDLLKISHHSYIFSSRGCPYRCTFCASSRFWDRVRLFSAHYVADEIKELYHQYGVRTISFFDDLFIISPERLEEIATLLAADGLLGKIKFTGSCRANLVNERTVEALKKLGVVSVGMGLESGNNRILSYLKGATASVDSNKKAVMILKKHGINVNASFVIGSPDEIETEMMETYNFIKNNPLDLVDIYVLTPMPGTPIWEYAKKRGLVTDNMDWSKLNVNFETSHKDAIILSEKYNADELYRIYKKFRRLRLYKNILNIWRSPFLADLPRYALKIIKGRLLLVSKG